MSWRDGAHGIHLEIAGSRVENSIKIGHARREQVVVVVAEHAEAEAEAVAVIRIAKASSFMPRTLLTSPHRTARPYQPTPSLSFLPVLSFSSIDHIVIASPPFFQ